MEELIQKIETLQNTLLNQKKVLTVEELSAYTGYAESYIYKLTSTKQIPHYKSNRKIFFDRDEIDAWVKKNQVQDVHSEVKSILKT